MTAEPGRDKPLLTPRAALIFVTSLVAALVIGALTYAARHSMPEAAIAGCGAFVTAAVFLNRVIELPLSPASGCAGDRSAASSMALVGPLIRPFTARPPRAQAICSMRSIMNWASGPVSAWPLFKTDIVNRPVSLYEFVDAPGRPLAPRPWPG
jgi:hypothetical protein